MKVVIQTIPARKERAMQQAQSLGLPCEIFIDHEMRGPLKGFIESIKQFPSGSEYRFHMQDDLILADNLKNYLPQLEKEMKANDMKYLSFYASRRKVFSNALASGSRIIKAPIQHYLPLLCAILSPWLVEKLLSEVDSFDKDDIADDMYLAYLMKRHKEKAYYHIPSLAQHDIGIKSSIGFVNNKMRTSVIFDKEYLTKLYA